MITGHSKGAAVANLLEYRLMTEANYQGSQIYGYNIACPDTVKAARVIWNSDQFDNIFNLADTDDPVSLIPGNLADSIQGLTIGNTFENATWSKFGHSYWFETDEFDDFNFDTHYSERYYEYFRTAPRQYTNLITRSNLTKSGYKFIVRCPVDIIVKDNDGNIIASVIDNEENYYDSEWGNVIIITEDDKKAIWVKYGENAHVELIGTDSGEMHFSISEGLLSDDSETGDVSFENVELETGKKFICEPEETIEESQLYIVDDSDEIIGKVMDDGEELQLSEYRIEFNVNGGEELGEKTRILECGDSYGTLPVPIRQGFTFGGWFTEKYGGLEIHDSDIFEKEENQTLYAHWLIDSFSYEITGEEVVITGYTGSDTEITIPSDIEGYPVTGIRNEVFAENTYITKITIPKSLTNIELYTLSGCSELKTAGPIGSGSNIEFGWTSAIPDNAFSGCDKLISITIPDSLTRIGDHAFSDCNSLRNIKIPESVITIGEKALGYSGNNILDGFTITGYSGSSAEVYANENGIPFINISVKSIADASVADIEPQTYTGTAIEPSVAVSVDGITLIKETDYTVVFENNINAGTAAVTIEGIGDYTGTIIKEFIINRKSITPVIELDNTSYVFDGEAKTPAVTVYDRETKLTEETDYEIDFPAEIVNAGTYTINVILKGNYTGSGTASFTITKASQKASAKASASTISVGKTAKITVTGNQGKVTYASANTAIAAVDETGKITAKKVGTVKISAVSVATANYKKKTVNLTIKVVPAATSKISAANKAGGIKIAWKKVAGATGYYIYRNGKLAKTIKSGSTTSWGDTKAATNGAKYTYKIVAYASTGKSTLSKSLTYYRLPRPAISSLANSTAGKMTVKWGKNTKATGYQVQYSTSSTFTSYKTITITKNTTISKVITSLTKGKTYYVRIRSYKKVNSVNYYSMWSVIKKLKITK